MAKPHNNNNIQRIASPLVHLNIQVQLDNAQQVNGLMVREQPFIGDLQLDADPDNLSLLIAVGEVMGVQQPLTVTRISCLGSMAILWLDQHRWLVLPPPGRGLQVLQALEDTFGQDMSITEQDGKQYVQLNDAAIRYLLDSQNTREEHHEAQQRRLIAQQHLSNQGVELLTLSEASEYDILVRQSCADQLWHWLGQKELKQVANG